jgi:prepilin-type N-terminal cleavage/methylation domain-containing protein
MIYELFQMRAPKFRQVALGFTLIELLIVVAIIAILAAVAVPNFLEAQTRAKAARAKSDLRTAATALESYSVDNLSHYPTDNPRSDLDGFLSAGQLTTPIAYISRLKAIIDPFRRDLDFVPADADEVYRYWNLAARHSADPVPAEAENGFQANGSWIISSAGPDRVDQYPATGPNRYETLPYDATNGTVSRGDILRTAKTGQK